MLDMLANFSCWGRRQLNARLPVAMKSWSAHSLCKELLILSLVRLVRLPVEFVCTSLVVLLFLSPAASGLWSEHYYSNPSRTLPQDFDYYSSGACPALSRLSLPASRFSLSPRTC